MRCLTRWRSLCALASLLAALAVGQRVAAEVLKARVLVGPWRCNSFFRGEQVSETLTYTATTYQSSILFHGQSIVVDGTYQAEPSGDNGLAVTYQPFNWRPRLLCSGLGGGVGNCAPLNFALRTDQLFFPRPEIFQVRHGVQLDACYKQK